MSDTRSMTTMSGPETEEWARQEELVAATGRARLCEALCAGFGSPEPGRAEPPRPLDEAARILEAANLLDLSGGVLLSSEATIRKNDIYFLGINPGGDEDSGLAFPTLRESLMMSRMGCNAFDQNWSTVGKTFASGDAPIQKRFKYIAQFLGHCYAEIPASNLVFTRSRNVSSHGGIAADLEHGLKVHELFLKVVDPKVLWVMGNPAHGAPHLKLVGEAQWEDARFSNWKVGRGKAELCGRKYAFCHTPHLSYWNPTGNEDLLRWIFEPILPPVSKVRAETEVLAMVKAWPGVPAQVVYEADGSWGVGTRRQDIPPDRR